MNRPGMTSDPSSANPESLENTKKQIRGLIQEIAELSKKSVSADDYFREMFPKVVSALAAVGGAVWIFDEQRRPRLVYQINITKTLLDPQNEDGVKHLRLIEEMFNGAEAQLLPPQSGGAEENSSGNPTNSLLVVAPITTEDGVEGVIEIFQRPDSQPASQRGYLRFLEQMCGLATEWFKSRQLKSFTDKQTLWTKIEQFSRAVHENLDLRQTAYTIANEGRKLIGCDRVSVALRRGGRWKIEAVSGQDVFDTRSSQVVLLGDLASTVINTGEEFWFNGHTEDLSPQLEEAVHDYVDESHTKTIAVIPLRRPQHATDNIERDEAEEERKYEGEILGALIVEQIEDSSQQDEFAKGVELISEHSSRALANSLDYNLIPLTPLWRAIARSRVMIEARNLPKTVSITAAVIAVILILFIVPAPFRLSGSATLLPEEQRDIFAAIEGEVIDVHVNHGDPVSKGQLLVTLENTDLSMARGRLLKDIEKAQKKLSSLTYTKRNPGPGVTDAQMLQVTIEYDQALLALDQHNLELGLLNEKMAKLQVLSPIDGKVVTWDVRDTLMQRPVQPGQIMLTVIDPEQDWFLEVKMPEKKIQHIEAAKQNLMADLEEGEEAGDDQQLEVSYIMSSDPGSKFYGKVTDIQRLAQPDADEGQIVKLKVSIDKAKMMEETGIDQLRTGATANAKVLCGTAPLGYTLFHELFEFIEARVLF
ncbi:MAG: HlyD family efflux transporter periplasmic adaptor subunit [Pirellulales bacterium]